MEKKLKIGELIDLIGPINNQIRTSDGYQKISLMWDVGNILLKKGIKKIHPIAWDIQARSYITRDLISYCYRIRKMWVTKQELYEKFRNLKSYSAFREALPLIENERFRLSGNKIKLIEKWLNNMEPNLAKNKILKLKKEFINIKNDRSRRLDEVMEEGKTFYDFYDYIIQLILNDQALEISNIKEKLGDEGLLKISQMCIAISNNSYKGPTSISVGFWPDKFKNFVEKIIPISNSKEEVKSRFKRVVSNEKIIELADIFNSFRTNESLQQIKNRLKLKI